MKCISWYVLSSWPQQEVDAFRNLAKWGCPLYLPMAVKEERETAGCEPLFPRYLFIGLNWVEDWGFVRATPSVTGIVTIGAKRNRYLPVPNQVVDALMLRENKSGYIQLMQVEDRDHANQNGGDDEHYFDLERVFQAEDGVFRSMMLIEMMGKLRHVVHESAQPDQLLT